MTTVAVFASKDTKISPGRILFLVCVLVLASCTTQKQASVPMPTYSTPTQQPVPPQQNPGSLFNPAEAQYLYGDDRARRVGDVVIVNIVENATSTLTADTTTERDSSITFGIDSWLGKRHTQLLPGGSLVGLNGRITPGEPMFSASAINEHTGTGETTRDAYVMATLAGRVLQVHPGGLLEIGAAREVTVNNETQIIAVTGLVRSRDIRPDNSILSSTLADAKIEYYGKGAIGDKQQPGWLTRILDTVWPF